MPLWTVATAAIPLDESINPAFVIGGALVIGGTYVGAFLSPRPRNAPVCQPCEAAPVAVTEAEVATA